jgi:hypothetical protein
MPLPQTISVRYTEEDAGYITVRPVVKQMFRLAELADMVVSVTGKDFLRVQQIFRAGSIVYNGYRYWWEGFSSDGVEIDALLAPFPTDDPSRAFDPAIVSAVLLESGGGTQSSHVEVSRQEASLKRLFRSRSAWDVLIQSSRELIPRYEKYAHMRRADLYLSAIPFEVGQRLLSKILEAAPRALRRRWSTLQPPAVLTFVCPRK